MDLKQFGEQLRALRKEAQWSQEQLIEMLDQLARAGPLTEYRVIDGTLLSRWEHARTQKGRQWKPTRTYILSLIRLFAPQLDLTRAQQWADQAGYQINPVELQAWFTLPIATPQREEAPAQQDRTVLTQPNGDKAESLSALPHTLPAALTSFVGREAEIARLTDYLATPTTRLITLVGEGGVGKTRLALQVAHTLVNERIGPFADGVYFVSLVGVSTASFVLSALANSLGFELAGIDEPFYTDWICYRGLTAAQDQRAVPLLQSVYRRLEMYASHIGDDKLRHSFFENVAVHRDLRTAYLQQRVAQRLSRDLPASGQMTDFTR